MKDRLEGYKQIKGVWTCERELVSKTGTSLGSKPNVSFAYAGRYGT